MHPFHTQGVGNRINVLPAHSIISKKYMALFPIDPTLTNLFRLETLNTQPAAFEEFLLNTANPLSSHTENLAATANCDITSSECRMTILDLTRAGGSLRLMLAFEAMWVYSSISYLGHIIISNKQTNSKTV